MSGICIYPGPHGEMSDEHYLPAALGRFEGCDPVRGRICRECNTRIGNQVEVQFLRAGDVAFFRWMLGIRGRDELPPSPFYQGAGGAPPLYMLGCPPGYDNNLLWEVEPGTDNVYPLRQIVFEHPLAGSHPVPILNRMRGHPEALIEHLYELGLDNARPVRIFAAPDEIPWVTELWIAVGGAPVGDWATTSFEAQRIPLVVNVRVTAAYFRAVAKIAFHYTLKVFPEVTGFEPEFSPIKEFIWIGGDIDRFVRQDINQFVENFRRGQRPTHWSHILAVQRTYGRITAYAQFFVSRHSLPPPYIISVGRNPSRIDRGVERQAHQFVILDPTANSGPVGVMADLNPAHYIWPV